MSLNRTTIIVAAGLLVLLAGNPASAQTLLDGQIFAPAELSSYGDGIQPNEGFFFRFDGIRWSISRPTRTTVGREGLTRLVYYGPYSGDPTNPPSGPSDGVLEQNSIVQSNSLDTSGLQADFTEGNRIEFGHISNRHGWMFGVYKLNNQSQYLAYSNIDMVFVDDAQGPQGAKLLEGVVGTIPDPDDPDATLNVIRDLPINFDEVTMVNKVEHWSTELMWVLQTRPFHHGGRLEFFAGVRYTEFDEFFGVDARGQGDISSSGDDDTTGDDDDDDDTTTTTSTTEQTEAQVPSVLADSVWNTQADNHIIGGQLGVRYFKICDRVMFNLEGRFLAGYNFQNIRQNGTLGSQLDPPGGTSDTGDDDDDDGTTQQLFEPYLMGPTSFTHSDFEEEFSPMVELRAELRYKLTRGISVGGGWTGIWVDNIARPSNLINYEVPAMGILMDHNTQDVFIHGWNLSLIVNR